MSFKANIPPTARDFYFSPVGRTVDSGLSTESPVSTPKEAVALINALVPPLSASNPASLTASVTGTYTEGIIVPRFTTCNSRFAAIVSIDPILVSLLGRHSAEWGALLSLSENATVVHISATQRVSIEVNALVTTGDNSVGIDVNGICDEIFIRVKLADLGGDGSVLVDHTASSATPIDYEFQGVRFMDENQTIIKYNDPIATTQTVFKIASGQAASVATSTVGSLFIDLIAGNIVVNAEVISAETVVRVGSGAILSLDCLALFGNTIILDGGIAIYKSIGVLFGDIEVQGSGTLQITATNVVGNIVTSGASSLSLKADQVVGDITIGAGTTAYFIIGELVGTLTNNGTINGIIGGVRYGNWRNRRQYETILSADSLVSQNPVSLDTPIQVSFGGAQVTGVVDIDAAGNVSVIESGQYEFSFTFQYGRAGSGGISWLFFRILKNGTQIGTSPFVKLENLNADFPAEFNNTLDLVNTDIITVELVRDSRGNNSGGLVTEDPILVDWNESPSASLVVKRSLLK